MNQNITKALPGPVRVWEPVNLIGPVLIQVPALREPAARTLSRRLVRTNIRRRRRLRR
jgi:hypothetical protein